MNARGACAAACVAAAVCAGTGVLAHKTIASPFTFHQDVRPILERRCAGCHADGGVAPTTLLEYEKVRSQSWPLRQVLISGQMPPWFGESGRAALKEPQALTPRELDVLMTWAAGGTPEGSVPAASRRDALRSAPPNADLVIAMPEPFTLAAQSPAADVEVALPSAAVQGRWIRAVDVLPGSPAIVRRAAVVVKTSAVEQVVGLWVPGDPPQLLEGNAAFHVPSDAALMLRVHYQRPRPDEAAAISDLSRVAVYLADPSSARRVDTIDITASSPPLDRAIRAVALTPISGPPNARVTIAIVDGRGSRTPLLSVRIRPEWPRRYVFVAPVAIARGSRIETSGEKFRAVLEIVE